MTAPASPPRVSVVMPVFDAGRDLARALRSVAAQTFAARELVIVDDGSRDPVTRSLLEDAAASGAAVVHRTANRGPAAARNLAIEHARAPYILPLDADDWLAPRFLERTVPVLDRDPAVGVVHTWVGLAGEHHGTWRTGPFEIPALLARCTVHVSSLFRREVWAQAGGYDVRFVEASEDWDFWLSAAAGGWRGHCVPEVLAYYHRGPRSRERRARQPGAASRRMRTLVAKHRALYERHLEDALGGLYEELMQASTSLERLYHHPAMRLALAARDLLRGRRGDG